ncbi:Npt1/Npt2 family nucleotide transporter [Robiginitalea sp. SC105]|uniref:Npt1/Npt2 family nucleotide transporter n=1 Tax=Robiginitalea sp. SC105 TaxID=2762332 RepID=UPI00163AF7D5|nr:Npt1/Npt2 family nucleotide transporter [Robiginitalea sp. SC105]MBC2838551.1 hypothetical protein [Robiginitalea sp. SC105]
MSGKFYSRIFQIRPGEGRIALLMFTYIFVAIAVLLMIKPTINSLFLSELGAENLPLAYLLTCLGAILSSLGYQRLLKRYRLKRIIRGTLWFSVGALVLLAVLLFTRSMGVVWLYAFYIWISLFGILVASQFWMLANLVFNVREAKRLFGFIGAGAISGGILGGYLTSLLSAAAGLSTVVLVAAVLLSLNLLFFENIWHSRIRNLGVLRQENRRKGVALNPIREIRASRHLSLLALIVAVGVLVAKLVDYLFSDLAARTIADPEELASFFGFWFSSFNLLSLGIQLLLTRRIVGVWGVGRSLLLLPAGILLAGALFFVFPELAVVIVLKALDGILKQSVNKSAFEMLALPLPLEVKQRTKYFIDVVVDSLATGVAGLFLIGMINGLDLNNYYVVGLVLLLALVWVLMIYKVRVTFYQAFRDNLGMAVAAPARRGKGQKKASMLGIMRQVLRTGEEKQRLYMLGKLAENPDPRLATEVQALLGHPSMAIRTAAIRILYYLDPQSMPTNIPALLAEQDPVMTQAVVDFLLLHANQSPGFLFEKYLEHPDPLLRQCALLALSREARDNRELASQFDLHGRLRRALAASDPGEVNSFLLRSIGAAAFRDGYPMLHKALSSDQPDQVQVAIAGAGLSMDTEFLEPLLGLLAQKDYRKAATDSLAVLGPGIAPLIAEGVRTGKWSLETCRFIPDVFKALGTQTAVDQLFRLFDAFDLGIRVEVVRALGAIRTDRPYLRFDRMKVVRRIHDECRLYQQTLTAMHSQIIGSYRNRRRGGGPVTPEEKKYRTALLDLLESRLEAGLERIFGLLGLKYPVADMQRAYQGMVSSRDSDRSRSLEFLDNLLTGTLRRRLLPILEEGSPEWGADSIPEQYEHRVPTEFECFSLLLELRDQKLVLAVLRLIEVTEDGRYRDLVDGLQAYPMPRVREAARVTMDRLRPSTAP